MQCTSKIVAKRFIFLFVAYFLLRMFFYLHNFSHYESIAFREIVSAFLMGARYDVAAILKINLVFFILWMTPWPALHKGFFAKFIFTLFTLVNFVFFSFNTIDAELISFSGQRLTMNYLSITQDINNQWGQLVRYYWFITIFTLFFFFIFFWYFPNKPEDQLNLKAQNLKLNFILIFLFVALSVVGVRGGLQNKPLRTAHAFAYTSEELGNLALNSSFTFLNNIGKAAQKKINFMSGEEAVALLSRDRTPHFSKKWSRPQNVLIIIVESLALEFVGAANNGKGYTPFIDKLSKKSLFFNNFFSNGRRSIEALPSILASVPSLLNSDFLTSNYQGAKILGLGEILKQQGYVTAFFHGAQNGSMFFDSFAVRAGFELYFGLREYPERNRDTDGFWGVYDEPFLQFTREKITEFKKPFAAVVFTLSSHQPYLVPSQYVGRFPKGTLEIHQSIGYTDYAIEQFFKSIESEPWYNNTLFVLTGDHTQKSDQSFYQNTLGDYRVPLILYHPQINIQQWPSVDLMRPAQHSDILPTVLDVLDVSCKDLSNLGSSVFSSMDDAFVVNRTAEGYWYLSKNNFIKMDFSGVLTEGDSQSQYLKKFKAYVQYVINGLIENKLFAPVENQQIAF